MRVDQITENQKNRPMYTHYIKFLLRKQPLFTALNFGGLVIAMTAGLLLFRYVRYEQTYDRQSPDADRIWRVFNQTLDGETVVTQDANTHSAVGPTLKREVPGVADFTRLYCGNSPEVAVLAQQKAFLLDRFYIVDQGFLRMFPQRVLQGNVARCLEAPHSAVLTESNAKRLFGSTDVLGQTVQITDGMCAGTYAVTAVVADPPENTHLKFDMLASYATRYAQGFEDNFESYWDYNYIQLAPGADPAAVRAKLAEINEHFLKKEGIRLEIQPFTDIHLYSDLTYELEPNGSARAVRFLGIVALLILGIAFINYINLATALANERGKEVGIRKAVGAGRSALTRQFMSESFLLCGSAFAAAVLCLNATLPWFGDLVSRPLDTRATAPDAIFWGCSAGFTLLAALLAGLYPALLLSGFKPADALRGRFTGSGHPPLRKGLVVLQFTFSTGLVFGVLVTARQLHFLQHHDLGVRLDQMVAVKSAPVENLRDTTANRKLALFKTECERLARVRGVAASNVAPGLGVSAISGSNRPLHWVQQPGFANITSYFVETDEQFFNLFGVKILAGEHRLRSSPAERYGTVSINKAMLDALGFPSAEAAVGQQIAYKNSENGATMTIGAVIDNFHIESLKTAPKPTLYYCFSPDQLTYLSLKIDPENMAASLSAIRAAWTDIFPQRPFQYWFLDDHFAGQYRSEQQFEKVFGLFTGLAVFISCLGLLGLMTYNVGRRRKEIGIRKVLGASVAGVTGLLAKDLLKLVAIAIVIASPVAWYFMNQWLAGFAYRIDIQWWMFAAAGGAAVSIAFLTVGFQALKAALANPVNSLRSE